MKISDIETPALIIDLDNMDENMRAIAALLEDGPALRPHYKSHKSTVIAHKQMLAGAKGITCAKLQEAEDLILSGIPDVLIANEITSPAKIARLAFLAGCAQVTVCVDNADNIIALEHAVSSAGNRLSCLIEYDVGMNRCGVHSCEEVLALAKIIAECPSLEFSGIQAYAGNLAHEEDVQHRIVASAEVELKLRALLQYLNDHNFSVKEVSGVSTGTVEYHAKDSVYTEVQTGSYLFMDMAYRAVGAPFRNSLFVLASVISRQGEAVITDAGMKSVSVDQRPPRFLGYENIPVEMSEEHSAIYVNTTLQIGDKMRLIPSHCCTTVNLYDFMYLCRGETVVDRIPITGRGHSL